MLVSKLPAEEVWPLVAALVAATVLAAGVPLVGPGGCRRNTVLGCWAVARTDLNPSYPYRSYAMQYVTPDLCDAYPELVQVVEPMFSQFWWP